MAGRAPKAQEGRLRHGRCENYALEKFEQDGADGWAKYAAAEIQLSCIIDNA